MELNIKLIVLVLISLFGIKANSSTSLILNCKFQRHSTYACIAIGLENHVENLLFSNVSGRHAANKSHTDVASLVIKNQNVSFVPKNIGNFFPQLVRYETKNSSLIAIKKENFKGLTKLETLILSNNFIEELTPDVFDDLAQLKHLRLSANELNRIPFQIFSKNTNLELITLDNNRIKSIHEELLFNLENLREIHLQNNLIEELREQTFARNEQLESIDVSNNKLLSVGPQLLKGLTKLHNYQFTNNICINQDYKTVEELTNLFITSCFPPYFKRFEDEIAHLLQTQETLNSSLSNCVLELETEKESSTDLKSQIETLNEEKSSLDVEHDECVGAKAATETDLDTCKSESEEKDLLLTEVTKNLTECESEEKNFLETLTITNKTVAKTMKDIKECKLQLDILTTTIQMKELQNEEPLKKLRNEVEALTSDKKLMSLRIDELTITNKQLTEKSESLKLENKDLELKLIDNQLERSENTELRETRAQLTSCKYSLRTCMNQLPICNSFFIDCTFDQIPKTDEYVCRARHVSACQPGMKLILDGTHRYGKSNNNVNSLDIHDSIFHFTDDVFKNLPYLRKIHIKNGGLSTLEPKLASFNLNQLLIEENNFNEIPGEIFNGVTSLESLRLDKNEIEKLHRDSFAGLASLRGLDLNGNKISDLPQGVFDELVSLTHLSLKHNRLTSLSGNLLQNNPLLEIVKFDDNSELKTVGKTLLDFSKSLRMGHFAGTCAGSGNHNDIKKLKESIEAFCQK